MAAFDVDILRDLVCPGCGVNYRRGNILFCNTARGHFVRKIHSPGPTKNVERKTSITVDLYGELVYDVVPFFHCYGCQYNWPVPSWMMDYVEWAAKPEDKKEGKKRKGE